MTMTRDLTAVSCSRFGGVEGTALRQVYYTSLLAADVTTSDLRQILAISQRNNRRSDITGLLVSSGFHVLQVLEGRPQPVEEILSRICRDPRHHGLRVVVDRPQVSRAFADWEMGYFYNLGLAEELEALCRAAEPAAAVEALLDRIRREIAGRMV